MNIPHFQTTPLSPFSDNPAIAIVLGHTPYTVAAPLCRGRNGKMKQHDVPVVRRSGRNHGQQNTVERETALRQLLPRIQEVIKHVQETSCNFLFFLNIYNYIYIDLWCEIFFGPGVFNYAWHVKMWSRKLNKVFSNLHVLRVLLGTLNVETCCFKGATASTEARHY